MSAPTRHFLKQVNRPATEDALDPAGARGLYLPNESSMLLEPMVNGLGDKYSFYAKNGKGSILKNLWVEGTHLVPRGGCFNLATVENSLIDGAPNGERRPGTFSQIEILSDFIFLAITDPYQVEFSSAAGAVGPFYQDIYVFSRGTILSKKILSQVPASQRRVINYSTDAFNRAILTTDNSPPIDINNIHDYISIEATEFASLLRGDDEPPNMHGIYSDKERDPLDINNFSNAFTYSARLFFIQGNNRNLYYSHTSAFKGEFRLLPLSGVFGNPESKIVVGLQWSYIGDDNPGSKCILITDTGEVGVFSGDPEVDWTLEARVQIPPLITRSASSVVDVEGQVYLATTEGLLTLAAVLAASKNDLETLTFSSTTLTQDIETQYKGLLREFDIGRFRIRYIPEIGGVVLIFNNQSELKSDIFAYYIRNRSWFMWEGMPISDIAQSGDGIYAVGNDSLRYPKVDMPVLDKSEYTGIYKVWENGRDIQYPYTVTAAYPLLETKQLGIHVEMVTPYIYAEEFNYTQDLVEVADIDSDLAPAPIPIRGSNLYWPNSPAPIGKLPIAWNTRWDGLSDAPIFDQIRDIIRELKPAHKVSTTLSLKFQFILDLNKKPRIEIHGFLLRLKPQSNIPGTNLSSFHERA